MIIKTKSFTQFEMVISSIQFDTKKTFGLSKTYREGVTC